MVRPAADGSATLDAFVAERTAVPYGIASWGGLGLRASVDREAAFSVPGVGGEGDMWSASWRWWANRPRFALGYSAPRVGRVRGVWRVAGVWEEETYAFGSRDTPDIVKERHAGGEVAVSDWITSRWRYAFDGGFEAWNGQRKTVSFGGSLERRFAGDKVSLITDATTWLPVAGGYAPFHAIALGVLAQSPMRNRNWAYTAGVGAERVSDAAPLGLWPGAGEGRARKALLRAHPLLDGGIVDATTAAMFGRTLAHANAEVQRWLPQAGAIRIGVAGFADGAAAARRGSGASAIARVDAGGGLRIKLPVTDRILRIDVAHGLADRANAVTIGWIY
jgi:hypothetical protein